jgi:DNA-binding Lrp family transcriptional regulator
MGMKFTENERATMYGLVRYPDLNDRELADKMDGKLSTVTAIRRRLFDAGILTDVTIPMMDRLGSEILVVGYGALNPTDKKAHAEMARRIYETHSGTFLMGDALDYGFFVGCAGNYTDVKSDLDSLNHFLSHAGLGSEPWSYALFPFAVSKILNCFDFSASLADALGLQTKPDKISMEFKRPVQADLSLKEKAVLRGLVTNPGMTDSDLTAKVDVSRQAIADMRRRFTEEGLIKNLRVPHLEKIGCELVTLTHCQFNPRSQFSERRDGIKLMVEESPHLFAVSGNFESIMMHSHQSYSQLDDVKKRLLSYYKIHDFIRGEPKISIFLSANLTFPVWFKFDRILDRALGFS